MARGGSGKTTAINFALVYLMASEAGGLDPFAKAEDAERSALEQFLTAINVETPIKPVQSGTQ
jgi:hypothetical protein